MKDLQSRLALVSLIAAADVAATATGAATDISAYVGKLDVIAHVGAATAGTNPTLDIKIQHSDTTTSGDFVDLTGATFTQVTTTASLQSISVDTRVAKKYIRAIATLGGTSSPSFPAAVHFVAEKRSL